MATNKRRIAASPDAVFAVLADGWLYPTWVVGTSRMRAVEETWPAVGARLHHSFGVWPAVIDDRTELLEWVPSRRAVMEAHGWPMGAAVVELLAEPTPEGCEVTIIENPSRGPGRLVPKPIGDTLIAARNKETLQRLAFLAEGHARPTG
jgi:Polyketide cyclase / dehydrase and lipid transport